MIQLAADSEAKVTTGYNYSEYTAHEKKSTPRLFIFQWEKMSMLQNKRLLMQSTKKNIFFLKFEGLTAPRVKFLNLIRKDAKYDSPRSREGSILF